MSRRENETLQPICEFQEVKAEMRRALGTGYGKVETECDIRNI